MSGDVKEIVGNFTFRLRQEDLTDDQARTMFYDLGHGASAELEIGLLETLEQHRPHLAKKINDELGNV